MQLPTDTISTSSATAPAQSGASSASRPRSRRIVWLAIVGALLVAAAVGIRNSPWARARELGRLSSHSLTLLALERPKDPLVFQWLGRRLYEEGDLPGSIQAFATAVQLDPRLQAAQLGLGTALLSAG